MVYRLQAITVKEALRLVENIGTTFKFRSGRVNTPGGIPTAPGLGPRLSAVHIQVCPLRRRKVLAFVCGYVRD